jgi:hypothetical protein
MRAFRKATVVAASAAALMLAAPTASMANSVESPDDDVSAAGTCGDTFSPSVRGGRAAWTILCNNDGTVEIDGWVKDTRADGRCAQVYGNFPDDDRTFKTVSACGMGTTVYFWKKADGKRINAYLRVR